MAAQATLTLKNWAAANVSYTALYASMDKGAKWADKSQGTLMGYRTVTMLNKHPTDLINGVKRVTLKVNRPVIDGTTGALSYNSFVSGEFVIPTKATTAERQELLAAFRDLMDNAVVTSAVVDDEQPT
jgi:hypothetical protein